MAFNPELKQILDKETRRAVADHRKGADELSHDEGHLSRVASFGVLLGTAYGFTEKELALAFVAGKMHDAHRSQGENPDSKDEEISAGLANNLLLRLDLEGFFQTTLDEREAVVAAIMNQGHAPARFSSPATRNEDPTDLAEKIHLVEYAGDKIAEANGPWIIARRPHFMGTRLSRPDGTWQEFGYTPGIHESLTTIDESAIRMSIVSVEDNYPKKLSAVIAPLFQVQRDFALGLIAVENVTVEDIAERLLTWRNEQGLNIMQVRKLKGPTGIWSMADFIAQRSGLTNQAIASVPQELALSSREATLYFALQHTQPLEDLVKKWQPQNPSARRWQQGMIKYLDGTLFDELAIA